MNTLWVPRFDYGIGLAESWIATLPLRPWMRITPTIGGARRSATGVYAAYVVRRDEILSVTVRFYESEWAELRDLIVWAQAGETFTFYPDVDSATYYTVDLESPMAGTPVQEVRSEFPQVLELTLQLRRTDGLPWELEYFPVVGE